MVHYLKKPGRSVIKVKNNASLQEFVVAPPTLGILSLQVNEKEEECTWHGNDSKLEEILKVCRNCAQCVIGRAQKKGQRRVLIDDLFEEGATQAKHLDGNQPCLEPEAAYVAVRVIEWVLVYCLELLRCYGGGAI